MATTEKKMQWVATNNIGIIVEELISDSVEFKYTESTGLIFSESESYVCELNFVLGLDDSVIIECNDSYL